MSQTPKTQKSKSRKRRLSPKRVLQKIRQPKLPVRFLQHWDPESRQLWFGCGAQGGAVLIGSKKKLRHADAKFSSGSRLPKETVYRFQRDPQKLNGCDLLLRLQQILRDHIHFDDERLYVFISLWIVGTYTYSIFSHYGYLFFHSKLPRSGKTRVEEVLSHLCFQSTVPLNAPTVPTIRDTAAEGGTVVLDTIERWRGKSPEAFSTAMDILDAGYRNGGRVTKMISRGDGNWQKVEIPVFSPYVLAAIDKGSLSDTALDRSFVVEMKRKSVKLKKRKYEFFRCEAECRDVRDDLYVWALQNAAIVTTLYECKDLETDLDSLQLNDRAADIWKPVFALARAIDPTDKSAMWVELTSLAVKMGQDEEVAEEARKLAIVQALRNQADGDGKVVGMTSDLLTHLQTCGIFKPDSKLAFVKTLQESELNNLLTGWGFEQKSIRLPNGPRRAWELKDKQLADLEGQLR